MITEVKEEKKDRRESETASFRRGIYIDIEGAKGLKSIPKVSLFWCIAPQCSPLT